MSENMSAARKAHLYALLAWNDKYTKETAVEFVNSQEYKDLNNTTWAETSIEQAVEGIKSVLLGGNETLTATSSFEGHKLEANDQTYDKVMVILEQIHDKWVRENAKKHDRGNDLKSQKNIYQHTPTALIGLDEVCKDLMFLAPFLKEMGVETGEMELSAYGSYKPNAEIAAAYQRYVEQYKAKNNITSEEELEEHVRACVTQGKYAELQGNDEMSAKRRDYMKRHISVIVDAIKNKNKDSFGKLPSQQQPE